jgi:predicted dehydrogenase
VTLRAGVIGLGVMGKNHARVLSNLDGVHFVGAVDPAFIPGADSLQPKLFATFQELIKEGIDYCVIAAPTSLHQELAFEAIDSGIAVLIEKPLSLDYETSCQIKDRAEKKSVLVGVGHIERFNAGLQQMKLRIQNGELGQVFQISTRRQGPFPGRISDVGVIKDLATHDIDLTSWLADSNYAHLFAQTANKSGRVYEDLVSVVGSLESGIVINHNVNWLSPQKERKVMVTGSKGTFVVDTLHSDLTFYANGTTVVSQPSLAHFSGMTQGDVIKYSFDKPEPLKVEHEQFRDKILNGDGSIVTVAEGCETVRVADAMVKSSQENQVIFLK